MALALAIAVLGALLVPAAARGAGTWLPASDISAPTPLGSVDCFFGWHAGIAAVDVAMNARGDAIAAWTRRSGPTEQMVQASFRPAGGSFGPPQDIGLTFPCYFFGIFGASPDAAIDGQGGAVVVFPSPIGGKTVIQAASRPPGGSFGAPVPISDDSQDAGFFPRVAMNSSGLAVAVFSQSNGTHTLIRASTRQPGGSFPQSVSLSEVEQHADAPVVAVNEAGATAVAWVRFDSLNYRAQARVRPPGGSFAAVQTLSEANRDAETPDVALDPANRATVIWMRNDGTRDRVQARFLTAAGAIGAGVDDVSADNIHGSNPRLGVDAANTAVAVWTGCPTAGGDCAVEAAARASNSSFDTVAQTISPPGGEFLLPTVVVDAAGTATAIWSPFFGAIQATRRPPGGQFGGVVTVGATSGASFLPSLAADDEGNVLAGWAFRRPSPDDQFVAQAAAYDAAPPKLDNVTVPAGATAGSPVAMAASASDRWSSSSISWNFGDGASASGASVSHTYGSQGTYTVTVTATDAVGNAASVQRTIQVSPVPPPAPIAAPSSVPDRDGDGFNANADCDDGNAAIRPGAREIAGNAVDENCDGVRAGFAQINAAVENSWNVRGSRVRALRLRVIRVPAGATIRVSCKGRGCAFKKAKTVRVTRAGAVDLLKTLKGANRRFRAGQTLEIRITAPNRIGKVISFRFKSRRIPTGTTACLAPGATRPTRC